MHVMCRVSKQLKKQRQAETNAFTQISMLGLMEIKACGCVAELFRHSVLNLVRSNRVGSNPIVGTILPQANSQLSCPSFRGR